MARMLVVIVGFHALFKQKDIFRDECAQGALLIVLGLVVGAILSDDFYGQLYSTIGFSLLLVTSLGFGRYLFRNYHARIFDFFFGIQYCYWGFYVINNVMALGADFLYGIDDLWRGRAWDTRNHHVIGIQLTVSSLYFYVRYHDTRHLMKYISPGMIALTFALVFVIQSRSNMVLLILTLLYFHLVCFRQEGKRWASVIWIALALGSVYFVYYIFSDSATYIARRFSITNLDYQLATNRARIKLYSVFLDHFLSFPFGSGIDYPHLKVGFLKLLMHNQYLTFVVSGGIIALVGVVKVLRSLFMVSTYKIALNENQIGKSDANRARWIKALRFAVCLYFCTLLTVEQGGTYFFIMFAILTWLSQISSGAKKHEFGLSLPHTGIREWRRRSVRARLSGAVLGRPRPTL